MLRFFGHPVGVLESLTGLYQTILLQFIASNTVSISEGWDKEEEVFSLDR